MIDNILIEDMKYSKVCQYIYMLFLNLRDEKLTSHHENCQENFLLIHAKNKYKYSGLSPGYIMSMLIHIITPIFQNTLEPVAFSLPAPFYVHLILQ